MSARFEGDPMTTDPYAYRGTLGDSKALVAIVRGLLGMRSRR